MTEQNYRGIPRPPAPGATALHPGAFDGETVFVTGGGTGLGKAIASEFARLGANLVIASRKPEHLEAGNDAISSLGGEVLTVACDIREPDSIAAAFDAAEERFGRIEDRLQLRKFMGRSSEQRGLGEDRGPRTDLVA